MKITKVHCQTVGIDLKPEYQMKSALGQHQRSEYVLVRVETDAGVDGAGEATVMPRWSGETAWGCMALIRELLGPALIGFDPHDVEAIDDCMDRRCAFNWFAKSAIEMACWDIQGKDAGKPVYELLGGPCRGLIIPARFSMGAYDLERARRRAGELVEMGFETVKVKVGGQADEDIARVRTVREVIGDERHLVIDANGGWDADTAIDCVNRLADARIALVEQPTPVGDYAALAKVRQETEPPVMADDTCFDLVHARELIRLGCCDVISVYPGKNGGIRKSQQIVRFAAEHGVACSIGSNLELDVATAAMGHLIVAEPNLQVEKYPGDILGPTCHEKHVVREPLTIEGPRTTIRPDPGLGVDVVWD